MSSKEKEILEKQRRLAAQLLRARGGGEGSSLGAAGTTTTGSAVHSSSNTTGQPSQKRPSSQKRSRIVAGGQAAILAAARAKAQQEAASVVRVASDEGGSVRTKKASSTHKRPTPSSIQQRNLPPVPRKKTQTTGGGSSSSSHAENCDTPANSNSTTNSTSLLAQLVQQQNSTRTHPDSATTITSTTYQPDDFWKLLREWNLVHDFYFQQDFQYDEEDENTNNNNNNDQQTNVLPDTFLNTSHYISAWAPLCMAECKAQILQDFQTNILPSFQPRPVQVKAIPPPYSRGRRTHNIHPSSSINNTTTTNDYNHNNWSMLEESANQGRYIQIQFTKDEAPFSMRNNDLAFLLTADNEHVFQRMIDDYGDDNFLHSGFCGIVGHAESTQENTSTLTLKVSARLFAKYGEKDMFFLPLGQQITALREFTALCRTPVLPLSRYLLGHHLQNPDSRRKLSRNQSTQQILGQLGGAQALGEGFAKYAESKFNNSQLVAIAASAQQYGDGGFTLIKGPPGTGKTTTLVAVLNSLHIRQYNKYYDQVRQIATSVSGTKSHALDSARKSKPRLLVCAPSNAAVDNIILKIMEEGFVDGQGNRYNPSMVRVGAGKSDRVSSVAIEKRVNEYLMELSDVGRLDNSMNGYNVELSRVTRDINDLRRRLRAIQQACTWPLSRNWEIRIHEETFENTGRVFFVNHADKTTTFQVPPPPEPGEPQYPATSMPEYRSYLSRIVKLVESYYTVKSHLERCKIIKAGIENGSRENQVRMDLETYVVNSVHMVMTTLGSAGNRLLECADKFEVVVVDEAAQSVEPATLSALHLGSRHAVLVGDPQQLPATIFNVSGRNTKYDRSLFQRLEEAGQPVYMLNLQYRMAPSISHFPRHIFYGGNLLDGPNVLLPEYGNPLKALVLKAAPSFRSFMILDLDSTEERSEWGTSLSNRSEALLAVYLFQQLNQWSHGVSTRSRVAVITPYAEQRRLLNRLFEAYLGPRYTDVVEVNTVDGYQGREASVVIFSAVRADIHSGIGFLADVRRMNVALTRAKHFLFVIARCRSIVVNPYWGDLVQHARETQAVLRVPLRASPPVVVDASLATQPLLPVFGVPQEWKYEETSHTDAVDRKPAAAADAQYYYDPSTTITTTITNDTTRNDRKRKHF